jgi:hypothetical protein
MKKIFVLFFVMTMAPTNAQDKNTTTIIVNNAADKEAFAQMLITHGNYIESDQYGVLTTTLRSTKTRPGWTHQYHYRVQFKDGTAILKPYWGTGINMGLGLDPTTFEWNWHPKPKGNINGIITAETMEMLANGGYQDISFE